MGMSWEEAESQGTGDLWLFGENLQVFLEISASGTMPGDSFSPWDILQHEHN